MATATIKECRQALHDLAVDQLPDGGLIQADDIKPFRTARLSTSATHLLIFCISQVIEPITATDQEEGYIFVAKLMVRYSTEESEETAEDYLDDLENQLCDILKAAQETDEWAALDFIKPSRRTIERVAGQTYKVCDIFFKLETR